MSRFEGRSGWGPYLSAPVEESTAAKEENDQEDDDERVGVHLAWMLPEHKDRVDRFKLDHYRRDDRNVIGD